MPRSSAMTFTCECGTTFASPVYQTVNVTLEPQLLYRLLNGTLNVAVCPNCGRKIESGMPFIYHDMRRGLFAYVSPRSEATEEEREQLLDRLRRVYDQAVIASERILTDERPLESGAESGESAKLDAPQRLRVRRRTPGEDLSAQLEPNTPPMQVIFGIDNLVALVDSLLEPEERLGRVALSAHDVGATERERLTRVAERLSQQLDLQMESEEQGTDFTIWLYGPRERVAILGSQLKG